MYDIDNAYPQRYTDVVNASGTAKRVTWLYSRFIGGDGFKDKLFYKAVVNRDGLTNDKLLRFLCKQFANRNGFAVHVNYNALYQKTELRMVKFEDCRLGDPEDPATKDKIAVYSDWAKKDRTRLNREKINFIDMFNPDPAVIQRQVDAAGGWQNYKGQILWFSIEGMCYPLAPLDAVIEDVETDGRIKSHKRKKAATGFNADYMFVHFGKIEDENERQDVVAEIEDMQGDESSGNVLMVEADTMEQVPKLIPFEKSTDKGDFYTTNETSVQNNIGKAIIPFPSVLLGGESKSTLGLTKDMEDAFAYVNGLTNYERIMFEEVFKMLFTNFHINVNPTNDYSIIPASFDPGNDKQPLAVQYGVGGTTALQAIISDPLMQPAQKINTLIIVFGLTSIQAQAIVNGTPLPESQQPE